MAGAAPVNPKVQFLTPAGVPLVGGTVTVYLAGTTTPTDTWQNRALTILNTNPITLDSRGEAVIWLDPAVTYKFVLKNFLGVTQWTVDNITGAQPASIVASLIASGGSALVGFIQAGSGAVARTVEDKGREFVSPLDFLSSAGRADVVNGTLALDHTGGVQAAMDTGRPVDLLGYSYKVSGLTVPADGRALVSRGRTGQLVKNGNGAAITISGDYFEMNTVQVVGTGYTGNNIECTGNHPRFINCSSYGTPGRALKATGSHVQILGTCGSYTTTDATASGYDIEIGVSGTATLYHQLHGVYTSQSTGGVLLIDTGSHSILGGQIGKLKIQAGTSPAGVNGGATIGVRVAGAVTVEVSNAAFRCNAFNDNVTVAAGLTSVSIDESNAFAAGKDIVDNSGNLNNSFAKNDYTGATPVMSRKRFGGSGSLAVMNWDPVSGKMGPDGTWQIKNGKKLEMLDGSGNVVGSLSMDGSLNGTMSLSTGATHGIVAGGSNGLYQMVNGTSITQAYSGGFRPNADNTLNLGTASQRWAVVYAGTGAINTSDARLKEQVRGLSDAERAVALRLKGLLRAFKFIEAVQFKGADARIHFGVIAQDVMAAFEAEGLDAQDYSLFCYDEWEAQEAVLNHTDEATTVVREAIPAGNRYGIRYEELLAFVLAAL
jgi:hypothetical protein